METPANSAEFVRLDQILEGSGAADAIDRLITDLADRNEYRALLDALLLKARHELGLALIAPGSLNDLPEPARSQYEERYVDAIRLVGSKLLEAGDIAAAWPYYRAIGDKEPILAALEAFHPNPDGDERLGPVVEIAFNQGVLPRKGFDLILDHYGACSAITAFESLPPEEAMRIACADRLTKHLHDNLLANLRADIGRRGQPLPSESASVADHLAGRDWLFQDDAYHLDVSHLMAIVRMSPLLVNPESIRLAIGLTDYGLRLSSRHRYEGDSPFENVYEDHDIYLRAVSGLDPDVAVSHFRTKLDEASDDRTKAEIAQVLVKLLLRLDRADAALDVAANYLAGYPDSMLSCPSVATLCQRLGKPERLAQVARDGGDLVNYLAARLQAAGATRKSRSTE